jgi:hypothetical protein
VDAGMDNQGSGSLVQSAINVLGLVILAAASVFIRKIRRSLRDRKAKKFSVSIGKSARVQALLPELRALIDADRIQLFQLHNGEYFLSGESAMKTSITHVYVKTGVAVPNAEVYQNIPTSHFATLFEHLHAQGYCVYTDKKERNHEEMDSLFRRMMNLTGANRCLVVPLLKKKDVWVGFVVIDWLDRVQVTDEVLQQSKHYAQLLADLLCD